MTAWFAGTILLLTFASDRLLAVQPMHHFHSLVAGEGIAGLRNGEFFSARFNRPAGIAQSEDGSLLYVSDQNNHCIRTIRLDEFNRVETLCGTGTAGYHEDACAKATFDAPTQLVALSGQRLLVVDSGNRVFRILDLQRLTTSTVQAVASDGGMVANLSANGVWGLVYDGKQNAFFFSQPMEGKLRRYDFATRRATDVEWTLGGPTQPAALTIWRDTLVVSDRVKPEIYQFVPRNGTTDPVQFEPVTLSNHGPVVAFANGPDYPVALRAVAPAWIRVVKSDAPRAVPIVTTEGEPLANHESQFGRLLLVSAETPLGFIEDRRAPQSYYFTSESTHSVLAIEDGALLSPDTRSFETIHSAPKPPGISRVLVLGDSRTWLMAPPIEYTPMLNLAKQLELSLNTRAALGDRGQAFQVIGHGEGSWAPIALWPYYSALAMVDTYDIDLIALVAFPFFSFAEFFDRPNTAEGIPAAEMDPEFMLRDINSRFPAGPYRDFLDLCRKKGLVVEQPNEPPRMASGEQLISDREVREALVPIVARPMRLLGKKLADISRRWGHRVRMVVYFTPLVVTDPQESVDAYRDTWREILAGSGIDFVDLSAPVRALAPTYFPTADAKANYHMSPSGFRLLAAILTEDILRNERIPPRVRADSATAAKSAK